MDLKNINKNINLKLKESKINLFIDLKHFVYYEGEIFNYNKFKVFITPYKEISLDIFGYECEESDNKKIIYDYIISENNIFNEKTVSYIFEIDVVATENIFNKIYYELIKKYKDYFKGEKNVY